MISQLIKTDKDVERAYLFARAMHFGQLYGDHDYVTYHLMGVADKALAAEGAADLGTVRVAIVALLHDVIEDTAATYDIVREMFGDEIGDDVDFLTKEKEEEYASYINGVKHRSVCILVKIADTLFNLENSVMNKNNKRTGKYLTQLAILTDATA